MAFARRLRQDQKKESAKALDLDVEQDSGVRSAEATGATNADSRGLEDAPSAESTGEGQRAATGGGLSYQERMQLAMAVARCQHQQRVDARREDPRYQQKCRERQEQRDEQRREREAQKEKEKAEAERLLKAEREAEAVRREEEAFRQLARRQRAAKIAMEVKLVREERAQQEKLRMQQQREERLRQRELSKERAAEAKRRAEDFRLLITMLDSNDAQAVQDTPRPPLRKRRRAQVSKKCRQGSKVDEAAAGNHHATLAICDGDPLASEGLQATRWEQTGLEALYASDDDLSSDHSDHSSSDFSPERSKLEVAIRNDSIVECQTLQRCSGAGERDLGLRQQASTRVLDALQEAATVARSTLCQPSENSAESRLWIVPHTNSLSLAASVLEEEANNVARSGYRTRIRNLSSALRRAPHAGAQARELLMHITTGDLAAARQFAALRPDALLTPAEQETRRLAEQEALRAAIVRPEDEGLPLMVRPELTCPACGVEAPRLQFVGFCREMECAIHGTHGGVGPQRYRASCGACLHSWFHMDGD
mmetsp:Transcript_6857/g.13106  ORF Transcript_6857/g.13106 Transcript_6857/m.13106 type:complete len:539 (-) Transcript_6857:100-1716(-)